MTAIVLDFVASDLPPERAWPPFLEWMRDQGLTPEVTSSIRIVGEGLAVVEVHVLDEQGRRVVHGDEPATETFTASLSCPPPLHPARGR